MSRTTEPVVSAGAMRGGAQPEIVIDDELTLRPFNVDDAAVVVEAFSTPDIVYFHSRAHDTEQDAVEWIEQVNSEWHAETKVNWAVLDRVANDVLGRVSMTTELVNGRGEVGYWMLPAGRSRGAATRACIAATQWAHDLGLFRVELEHSTSNEGSRRVALAAGFVEEGVKRSSALHADGWHDMVFYSHLRTDRVVRQHCDP